MQVDRTAERTRPEVALESAVLRRLSAEVATGEPRAAHGAYNRTYNRHNR